MKSMQTLAIDSVFGDLPDFDEFTIERVEAVRLVADTLDRLTRAETDGWRWIEVRR